MASRLQASVVARYKAAAKFKPGDQVKVKPSHGSPKFRGDTLVHASDPSSLLESLRVPKPYQQYRGHHPNSNP